MRGKLLIAGGIGALALAPASAGAHHSYGMFDLTKQVVIEGTVKEFQWTNPHIFVQVMAPGPDGKLVEYSVEGTSPGVLRRAGWKFNTLKAGEKVKVVMSPLRDSRKIGGMLMTVTTADGTVHSNRATDTAPPRGAQ
jgi:hypothetical protein